MLLFNLAQDLRKFWLLPLNGQTILLAFLEPGPGEMSSLIFCFKLRIKRNLTFFLSTYWPGQKQFIPFWTRKKNIWKFLLNNGSLKFFVQNIYF